MDCDSIIISLKRTDFKSSADLYAFVNRKLVLALETLRVNREEVKIALSRVTKTEVIYSLTLCVKSKRGREKRTLERI